MSKPNYGILHNHSENSVRDSAMSIKRMFQRAQELGATAVALTDHGILSGYYEFMTVAKDFPDIKPIPGMEAYFVPDNEKNAKDKSMHLILMAKDKDGWQAICDANTDAYGHTYFDGSLNVPRMDMSIIRAHFGPGTPGHGHVIATSACIAGPMGRILTANDTIKHEAEKIARKRDKYHPVDDELLNALKEEEELADKLNALIEQRDALQVKASVKIAGLLRRLKTLEAGSEEYATLDSQIKTMQKEQDEAKAALLAVKKDIATAKANKTKFSQSVKKMKESADKWVALEDQRTAMLNTTESDEQLYTKAVEMATALREIFGKDQFFVELQYHHITDEARVMPVLAKLAKELSIPVVAANDAHYATDSYDDIRARTLVAAMRFPQGHVEEGMEGFGELYMKSEDELRNTLLEILDEDTVSAALDNIRVITAQCDMKLDSGTHYPVFRNNVPGETSMERLRRLANEGIAKRYPGTAWTPEMQKRMEYELSVIESMGFADYHCIVQDYLNYGRSLATDNPEKVGYSIGPGRGSAVGSLVCYLIGITSVDPIKYGLIFERFLNPERVSMPDIDSDFSPEIRGTVINYVREMYRTSSDREPICGIMTKGTLAARAAIRAVGRVTDIPASIVKSVADMVPKDPHAIIDDIPNLKKLCDDNAVIAQLIRDAKLVEGVANNYGMHAAGVIISDNGDVGAYVPLMFNSDKDMWVAQCEMAYVEEYAGLLKMDFLGLKNLSIITDTLRRIYRNYGVRIDIEAVPQEPEVYANIFAAGNTDCVFQFESSGMKKMLRQFGPTNMEDIILLNAAYRPGPMQYIPVITDVKNGRAKPKYICDGMEEILGKTYGSPIYQEQIMEIFHTIAGFSMGESDIIRRAMSKKKMAVLTNPKTDYHGRVIRALVARGATADDAEAFWTELLDFANYAFNKSHAAAYAHVAYYTAWLKYHYPAEYMCSVISQADFKKLPVLINECRRMGLTIERPNINHSVTEFTNTSKSLIFGFGNIKGVGESGPDIVAERDKSGPFTSVKDFVTRMLSNRSKAYKKDVMVALVKAGAFDEFCSENRRSILTSIEELVDTTKKMLSKEKEVNERVAALEALKYDPTVTSADIKKAERGVLNSRKSCMALKELYVQHSFPLVPEDVNEKLQDEYALLGLYVSGSPFDAYSDAAAKVSGRIQLTDALECERSTEVTVCGILRDIDILQRKSDGQPFCSGTLIDETTEMTCKCFVRSYAEYRDLMVSGNAVAISGVIRADVGTQDDGTEIEYERYIDARKVKVLRPNRKEVILASGASLLDWENNFEAIQGFTDANGYQLYFYDELLREVRQAEFPVSDAILTATLPGLLVSKTNSLALVHG